MHGVLVGNGFGVDSAIEPGWGVLAAGGRALRVVDHAFDMSCDDIGIVLQSGDFDGIRAHFWGAVRDNNGDDQGQNTDRCDYARHDAD